MSGLRRCTMRVIFIVSDEALLKFILSLAPEILVGMLLSVAYGQLHQAFHLTLQCICVEKLGFKFQCRSETILLSVSARSVLHCDSRQAS